jgi:DNA mismatch endonuclease (patch repair protein)
MRAIRGKDTSLELVVRSYLHRAGFRFRVHVYGLPGSPDIVLRRYATVIFIHGCFWHQHDSARCPHTGVPLSNRAYWKPKLERTVARDRAHKRKLRQLGWRVVVVWECQNDVARLQTIIAHLRAMHPKTRKNHER